MTPIPIGLVGAGKHGSRYLQHVVADVPELRIALLSRRDERAGRAYAESCGARFVADFRELSSRPRSPPSSRSCRPRSTSRSRASRPARRKALLIEKPLAVDVAGAREIVATIERAAVPAMVAHTLRFNQVVRTLAAELPKLGRIHQLALAQRFEPSTLDWLDDPAHSGGGMILHTGVHSFDLIRMLTGRDPSSVVAVAKRLVTKRTEDAFAATFRFDGEPLVASVTGSRATPSRWGSIEIVGERGQLVGDHHHGTAAWIVGGEWQSLDPGPPVPTVRETLRAFARMLTDGAPPAIPLREGLWSVACAEACYRSIELERFALVNPEEETP